MDQKNRTGEEQPKSSLWFNQIAAAAVILILLLLVRALDNGTFVTVKNQYDKYSEKGISVSGLYEKFSSLLDLKGQDGSDSSSGPAEVTQPHTEAATKAATATEPSTAEATTEDATEATGADALVFAPDSGSAITFLASQNPFSLIDGLDRSSRGNDMLAPVDGQITDYFGARIHPITGEEDFHGGLDLGADEGTPIAAAYSGTVTKVSYDDISGNYLFVTHEDGVDTFYCHCSEIVVKEGAYVVKGQTIAKVGSTGSATGPHVHFEIRVNDVKINPLWILDLEDE